MSPILVPTLAELGIELDRAVAVETEAHRAWLALHQSGREAKRSPEAAACDAASEAVSDLIDQIAGIPAATIADLRVKAMAMEWHNRTVEAPDDFWTRLGAQIVDGLLDSSVA